MDFTDIRNESEYSFTDISIERRREYRFDGFYFNWQVHEGEPHLVK
jgi:hypothetical protein